MESPIERIVLAASGDPLGEALIKAALAKVRCRLVVTPGCDLFRLARTERPAAVLLGLDGACVDELDAMRDLRVCPQTRRIPVATLGGPGPGYGADDHVPGPLNPDAIAVKTACLLRSAHRDGWLDPVTRLPGRVAVEEEVSGLIMLGRPFAFTLFDINGYDAFSASGEAAGRELLEAAARAVAAAVAGAGGTGDMAGYMGGGGFAAVNSPEAAEAVASAAAVGFGGDQLKFLPSGIVPAFTIGIASSLRRRLAHPARALDISSELVKYLRGRSSPGASVYMLDRRYDPGLEPARA